MKAIIPLLVLITGSSVTLAQETEAPATEVATETPQQEGVTGVAHALDGNTILLQGRAFSLFAIRVPTLNEPGGYDARAVVDEVLTTHGSEVTCVPVRAQTRSTPYALCKSSGVDLGKALIKAGWARVARRTLHGSDAEPAVVASYRTAEADARAAGLGLWAQPVARWWESWWFEIVKTLLTVAGAVFGFWLAAGFNFRRNRALQEHAREQEVRSLAAALEVEFCLTFAKIQRYIEFLRKNPLGKQDSRYWPTLRAFDFGKLAFLEANFTRLDLLDADVVVAVLGCARQYDRFQETAAKFAKGGPSLLDGTKEMIGIAETVTEALRESVRDLAKLSGVPEENLPRE